MNEKCNGYESMYLFLNDEDFKKHLENCEECAKEHEKIQNVSELIQEAKPYILACKRKNNVLKTACAIFIIMAAGLVAPLCMNLDNVSNIIAMNSISIEEMGLPVDEYGFLMLD
jgi:hypothetical protein